MQATASLPLLLWESFWLPGSSTLPLRDDKRISNPIFAIAGCGSELFNIQQEDIGFE